MKDHIDIMVDLETLSLDSRATITQIASSTFDLATGDLKDVFDEVVNPMSGVASGSVIDGSTVVWWMQQDRKVINDVLVKAIVSGKDIKEVLTAFSKYVEEIKIKYGVKVAYLWGNGSKADNVWLENAYKMNGLKWPFHYREDMDLRTLIRLGTEFGVDLKNDFKFKGNRHVALDDVRHQIAYACATLNAIKDKLRLIEKAA